MKKLLLLTFLILFFNQKIKSQNVNTSSTHINGKSVMNTNIDEVIILPDYYPSTHLLSYMDILISFTKNISNVNGKFYMIPDGESVASIPYYIIIDYTINYWYQNDESNFTYYCDEIEIIDNKITIPYSNYFTNYGHYLKFETTYELVFIGDITFIDGEVIEYKENDVLSTFQTINIPSTTIRADNEFALADVPNLGFEEQYPTNPYNTRYQSALWGQEFIHFYQPVEDDNIYGDDINVAIVDTKIYENSLAYNAVVYDSSPLKDEYFVSKSIIPALTLDIESVTPLYGHGTQMARYMLNYAPKANIYAMNKLAHMPQLEDNFISTLTDPNNAIDIASFSGSYSFIEDLGQAIHDGLIVTRSLGNDISVTNTFDDYTHIDTFLPHDHEALTGSNRATITGAFVTLQAVIFEGCDLQPSCMSAHRSVRSQAGDAKSYTLSIAENGSGATSEATATFAGMVALMLDANKKYGNNYTPRNIVEILFQTATDIGDPGVDRIYGYGVPNLRAALGVITNNEAVTFTLYEDLETLSTNDSQITNTTVYMTKKNNLRVNGVMKGEAEIRIYSLLGKQVFSSTFLGQETNNIKIPFINSGIYIVRLKTDEGLVLNKKILIN